MRWARTSGGSPRSTSPASCSARWSPRSSPRRSASAPRSCSSPRCSSACSCSRRASTSPPGVAGEHARTRAAHAARAPRDPGDPRGERRVLPDRRHVRGDLGGAAARPRRGDVAHRPHAVAVHAADDLPRADRRPRRAVARSAARRRGQPDASPTVCTFSYGVLPEPLDAARRCRWSTRSPTRSPCRATRWRPRSAARPSTCRPRRDCSARPALAAAGLTGLAAGFVYEEVGRFAVCTGTAVADGRVPRRSRSRSGAASSPTRRRWSGTDAPLAPDAIGSGVPDLP